MKIIGGTDKDKEDEALKRADALAKAIIKMLPQHLSHRETRRACCGRGPDCQRQIPRRADRILSLGYCGQRVVLDFDRFSGIARSGQSFGYDQRDWLTDVPHLAERKHGTRRVVPRRAVTIDQWHHAGHVAETVCPNVLSGSHKQHPRHAPRRRAA
jgi:hypothetical protein